VNNLPRNERARKLWARTRIRLWPERYWLVSLDTELAGEAGRLLAADPKPFAALICERDEVSLTVEEGLWKRSSLRHRARNDSGAWRVITFDLALDLDVSGYIAPAVARLAEAAVAVVPQCAFEKDHLLVPAEGAATALRALRSLVRDCRRVRTKGSRARAGRRRAARE
jgi:hypothetical protein